MNKKELRKTSLEYRTLASQLLKINSVEEINFMAMFYNFISENILIRGYIDSCCNRKYDLEERMVDYACQYCSVKNFHAKKTKEPRRKASPLAALLLCHFA